MAHLRQMRSSWEQQLSQREVAAAAHRLSLAVYRICNKNSANEARYWHPMFVAPHPEDDRLPQARHHGTFQVVRGICHGTDWSASKYHAFVRKHMQFLTDHSRATSEDRKLWLWFVETLGLETGWKPMLFGKNS